MPEAGLSNPASDECRYRKHRPELQALLAFFCTADLPPRTGNDTVSRPKVRFEASSCGNAVASGLLPGVAHPGNIGICVLPQPEDQLGGVVLDVADVVDVQLGSRAFAPTKA